MSDNWLEDISRAYLGKPITPKTQVVDATIKDEWSPEARKAAAEARKGVGNKPGLEHSNGPHVATKEHYYSQPGASKEKLEASYKKAKKEMPKGGF